MNPTTSKDTLVNQFNDRTALTHLKELYLSESRQRYPNVPEDYRAYPEYKLNTSNGLTRSVMQFLRLKGHFVERTGNQGNIKDTRKTFTDVLGQSRTIGSITRIPGTGTRGTSDLKAIIQGQFIAIEIKCAATNDRQSESQKQYQFQVESSGGTYLIATSLPQFLNFYYSHYEGAGR